uniref:AMP-dependent synthetase/ligase domain-containing protein n=1 Tax=Pseudo-nitzschia australis TaxID=44445 RepID=A0A6U9VNK5_9STRA|mmetsp:Transcript_1875/g.4153  ORF Transcript_1875/g.4153 Transcript_1875/m.4153 type:complete len:346 (+) Transcript_1875:135-1172(+)|eukprot:CAMPEP_0168193106 /NCGR_PEP_ID=MMETSP0139_2-20121125/18417_1 /TAXON_ID=44445 /ORGANISM="Pseudo-nitzschia australis, Strain 10249 10 AB" /LENGTH=345 /DNA_ID=CAMNT_0008116415 /DNA_START=68 /DNA_END=1105 /DNA_ORIENTATION=+
MASRMTVKTIAAALDATALRIPDRIALVSPSPEALMRTITAIDSEGIGETLPLNRYTYSDFRDKTNRLAGFLKAYGYGQNDVIMSDLPNVAENLVLQIACNRIGVTYATAKGLEGMAKLTKVKGAVSATGTGFLAETSLSLPYLSGDFLLDLIHGTTNGTISGSNDLFGLKGFQLEDNEQSAVFSDDEESATKLPPHAYYNSAKPFTNEEALEMGADAAWEVAMVEEDIVCVAITLCHAFGMGSAVCSTLKEGATIVLPAVGGIRGCGIPSQRAEATLQVLESEKCTLLFADTHTLKAFPNEESIRPERLSLKGGACKVGSGSTFLEETVKCGGATLRTLGSIPK